jgi:hypothetical protein
MVAPTGFGITLPSSGSVPRAFWEMLNRAVDRILWMGVLCRTTLLIFLLPGPFPLLRLYQRISPGPRHSFQGQFIYGKDFGITLPNPKTGGPPLVGCSLLLSQYIHGWPPYWSPFLYPQPEHAPCRGDRDPLIMDVELLQACVSDGFW